MTTSWKTDRLAPDNCYACGQNAWVILAYTAICGQCKSPLPLARKEQVDQVLTLAAKHNWPMVYVGGPPKLVIGPGIEDWQHWATRMHEAGAQWLVKLLTNWK